MRILGIETSCDETAAAVVEDGTKVLSSVVASSEEIHKKYGGIVPELAAREQVKAIIPVVHEALQGRQEEQGGQEVEQKLRRKTLRVSADLTRRVGEFAASAPPNIDAIAVTYGPGLIGSLLVGVETAKTLAWVWNKPLIPVNHLLAHVYGAFLVEKAAEDLAETGGDSPTPEVRDQTPPGCSSPPTAPTPPQFPFITLIVSGGHTDLLLMKSHTSYQWLGGTRDDAAGEAFDKVARLLGLGYPGGLAISKEAEKHHGRLAKTTFKESKAHLEGDKYRHPTSELFIELPRPMINSDDFDFSFSGLKTAVRYLAYGKPGSDKGTSNTPNQEQKLRRKTLRVSADLTRRVGEFAASETAAPAISLVSYEFQEAVVDVLVKKTIAAGKKHDVRSIVLCGGVSANKRLRERMRKEAGNNNLELHVPRIGYSTDNAAMVASRGYFTKRFVKLDRVNADPSILF